MMKKSLFKLICFLAILPLISSCIQDEPKNAECDIEQVIVPGDVLKMDPRIENDAIFLMVKPTAYLDNIAPEFVLTPGATIDPPSGTPRNFETPQTYVVTSEDKQWSKTYTVTCSTDGIITEYNFEHFELSANGKYYVFYEVQNDQKQFIWASGNAGFSFVASKATPDDYPTTPYAFGKDGNCLRMTTKKTGSLGAMMKMPIAAGSLFIGEFDTAQGVTNPTAATHFGVPFDFVPIVLKGYYKYTKGPEFMLADGKIDPDRSDSFDLYAILYETDAEVKYLDGTNFLTSPNLISIARMKEEDKVIDGEDWTYFILPFILQPGKTIDVEKLNAGKYNVSIVMSSSINGDKFQGAPSSELLVDEVELVHF